MESTNTRKMSNHQSLHLAQIKRAGGSVAHSVVLANGEMYVRWEKNGRKFTETIRRDKREL